MAFGELAQRLAKMEIVIHRLDLLYGSVGSWEMIVVKQDEAVRFSFDGRDKYVTAEVSPKRPLSWPNQWTRADAKGVSGHYLESIAYAEAFLVSKFGV